MSREHTLDRSQTHHDWDNSREPVLAVRSGDVVHLEVPMGGRGQVSETSRIDDVVWDFATAYNLAGPILVEGAKPGDTLEIEFLSLVPGDWGWTAVLPGIGLLADDFPDGYLKIWRLGDGAAQLTPNVRVPIAPLFGTVGVAPDDPGRFSPFPPHKGGGNIDNRHLGAGCKLWLPIWCEGALVSCGDGHAAQGDGEVCGSAIECDMSASVRLRILERHVPLSVPSFHVPASARKARQDRHGTMGIHADLYEGARMAVRGMVAWIVEQHQLSPVEAYVLASVAGDLHVHEIVNAGVWNVGMTLPLDLFSDAR